MVVFSAAVERLSLSPAIETEDFSEGVARSYVCTTSSAFRLSGFNGCRIEVVWLLERNELVCTRKLLRAESVNIAVSPMDLARCHLVTLVVLSRTLKSNGHETSVEAENRISYHQNFPETA